MVWGRGIKRRLKPLENTPGGIFIFLGNFRPFGKPAWTKDR